METENKMGRKPILIQGAMEEEISYIKANMEEIEEINIHGYIFYKGKIKDCPIVLSKTQIGIINETLATFIGITEFSPFIIINQGVAGGSKKKVHKGDIVIGESVININSFQTLYKDEKEGSNSLEWDLKTFKEGIDELVVLNANKELVNIVEKELQDKQIKYHLGRIGSGDVWNEEKDRILHLSQKYKILCEDMETIACYQVAQKLETPVIGIRAISNNILNQEEYDKNISQVVQKVVLSILDKCVERKDKIWKQ